MFDERRKSHKTNLKEKTQNLRESHNNLYKGSKDATPKVNQSSNFTKNDKNKIPAYNQNDKSPLAVPKKPLDAKKGSNFTKKEDPYIGGYQNRK